MSATLQASSPYSLSYSYFSHISWLKIPLDGLHRGLCCDTFIELERSTIVADVF